jgi:hypothetical protein
MKDMLREQDGVPVRKDRETAPLPSQGVVGQHHQARLARAGARRPSW